MNNYIPQKIMDVVNYPCPYNTISVSKVGPVYTDLVKSGLWLGVEYLMEDKECNFSDTSNYCLTF